MRDCSITIMDCFIILILRRIPQYPFAISRIAATFQQGKTKNTTCNAANDDSMTIFPYQGKLYGIETREDGIGFFVSELDGSNRKSKENFIDAGGIFDEGIIVRDKLFYLYDETIDIVESDGIQEVTLKWHFNVLDLKSMKQEEILSEETDYMGLLGGTTEYMVYSVIREGEPSF